MAVNGELELDHWSHAEHMLCARPGSPTEKQVASALSQAHLADSSLKAEEKYRAGGQEVTS
jgi:hypothetical protein